MSRVIVANHCRNCPYNDVHVLSNGEEAIDHWCQIAKRDTCLDGWHRFPAWCPLPKKEESDERVR